MKKTTVLALSFNGFAVLAQTKEEQTIKEIYKSSLTNSKCYTWLDDYPIKSVPFIGICWCRERFYIQSTIRDPCFCISSGSDGAQMERGEKKLPTYKIIKLKLQYLFVLWEDP
jgi:hypothetical protein